MDITEFLPALDRVAEACRSYLRVYDEFYPENPVDLGPQLDLLEEALAALSEGDENGE